MRTGMRCLYGFLTGVVIGCIFLTGALFGSYMEVQHRGLSGKTIKQCAVMLKEEQDGTT